MTRVKPATFLLLLVLLLLKRKEAAATTSKEGEVPNDAKINQGINKALCRSNKTHIMWPSSSSAAGIFINVNEYSSLSSNSSVTIRNGSMPSSSTTTTTTTRREGRRKMKKIHDDDNCWYQTRKGAENNAMKFLHSNVMDFDLPFRETMGFPSTSSQEKGGGLSNGLIGPTIRLSLDTKIQYEWADKIPQNIFLEYVLNYANVNEARTNWRPLISNAIKPYINKYLANKENVQINDVVKIVNKYVFQALGRDHRGDGGDDGDGNDTNSSNSSRIYFVSSQTPLIFDPMSVIAYQYASCTGFAILFVNALRSVGIPARIVGTPAWQNNITKGNHNWVEVFRENGQWDFMGPSAGTTPYEIPKTIDHLDVNPCKRWFCNKKTADGTTNYYAARLSQQELLQKGQYYPMAWELDNKSVPGINRTEYYISVCSKC